jgi:hypothetical protein
MKKKHSACVLLAGVALALSLPPTTYAQSDVTQPGDAIIASSDNSPGSEGVANAIDNQPTKYLNFDIGDTTTPVGFVVTPSVGATVVTGLALQSANDSPDRDPRSVRLEGSNDADPGWETGNWKVIYENNAIESWETLFGDDNRFQTQVFTFENPKPYLHYRVTILETQGPSTCCFQIAEVELLGEVLAPDVTQPGDPIIASSDNSPGSEGVANAIDNQPTKYLNFDIGDTTTPVGFVVSPSIGSTLVTGISLQSANDAPDRDPRWILLEGSNDESPGWDSGNWTLIYENTDIESWETLFGDNNRFRTQTFLFSNIQPYRHYRLTIMATQGPSTCCMQIAEVALHGGGAPRDVTQPGDTLIASSDNSPGSEGVANAIDNQPTKYLNFDIGDGTTPVGFVVTPQVGPSKVVGITLMSANDSPDRDPRSIRLEGSNDEAPGWDSGNWTVIYENNAIESWESLFGDDNRFQTQAFYFENKQEYRHYRWTVLATQGPSTCCMQIAEVELLAQLASNPCEQVAFITPPVDTPALEGESATFFTEVNGPWSLQWYKNGEPIPGATQSTYTTDPVTADNADDTYSVEIVGCVFSQPVKAVIFTPSDVVSYGLNFLGGGANGAPTAMAETDIAGFWPQAYWNNLDGGNQTDLVLTNSNGQVGTVIVTFTSSGTWGAGTGTDSADQRMLNGLIQGEGTITFDNVPDGAHSIIAYSVARPLEFPNINLTANGTTIYGRQMNADEYNPAPGFYSMTSTDPDNRSVGNMTRFDGITPTAGQVSLSFAGAGGGNATINGLQLILDAPATGAPPSITQQPKSQNILEGRRAVLSVEVTGAEPLSYQWRKDGFTLFDGEGVSGSTTSQLVITGFDESMVGRYDVAISNPAGTVVSSVATLNLWNGEITDSLVGHWKLDETSGMVAANSAGGTPGQLKDAFTPGWRAGQIDNGLYFDTATWVFVENYTKAEDALSVSLWVRLDSIPTTNFGQPLIRNWGDSPGQFNLAFSDAEPSQLLAQIRVGPNTVTAATEASAIPMAQWAHVAMTADGARLTLYVNGQPVTATDYIGNINKPAMDWLAMGAVLDNTGEPLPDPARLFGMLDDIGLWTRALSASEIQAIYDAGLQGKDLSTVVIEIPEEPEITDIRIDAEGNVVIEFIGVLVYSPTVKGEYTPVDGATSPFIATQPGFYQAKGQ